MTRLIFTLLTLLFFTLGGTKTTAATIVAPTPMSGVTVLFEQIDADVIATVSGRLNITGLTTSFGVFSADSLALSNAGIFRTQVSFTGWTGINLGAIVLPAFGTGGLVNATSSSGDTFGTGFLNGADQLLALPPDYISGDLISSQAIFGSQSLFSMGLVAGSQTQLSLPNDTITFIVGPQPAVPLPASLPLALIGLASLWQLRRRAR